jgi:hypothetical protein
MKHIFLFLLLLFSFSATFAQQPCSAPEYREFDFWVGKWEVYAKDKLVGHNTIEPILGGCTLLENWESVGASRGNSFNTYNAGTKQWEQTWVDNSGSVIHFYGNYADGKMSFTGKDIGPKGEEIDYRFTFYNNADGTVRQHWEQSSDGKETWQTIFDGLYKRMKEE